MSEILVITPDLIFSTRIVQTAAAHGVACAAVRGLAQLQQALAATPRVAFVDVEADADGAFAAIAEIKARAPEVRVVAYYSHVRADHAAAARSAGADEILTRSAFVAKLPTLLAGHA